jgi:prolipoprotein diacylglyceryltransferase
VCYDVAVVVSLAALPAPPGNAIHLGRLQIRAYGAMIALGIVAAMALAERRWVARGGRREDITALALWAVPAGFIGARIYHVITDPELFRGRWLHVFAVWEGGLGIPGGRDLALVVVLLVVERHVRLRPGRLCAVYVAGYSLGRLWIERLRIDHANRILGLRVNEWVSLVTLTASLALLLHDRYRSRTAPPVDDAPDVSA